MRFLFLESSINSRAPPVFQFLPRVTSQWVCQRCSSRFLTRETNPPLSHHLPASRRLKPLPPKRPDRLPTTRTNAIATQNRAASHRSNDGQATLHEDLPSQKEGRRSHVAKRFSHLMDHLQSNMFIAGQRLNDLTGYSGIEALKKDIEGQG